MQWSVLLVQQRILVLLLYSASSTMLMAGRTVCINLTIFSNKMQHFSVFVINQFQCIQISWKRTHSKHSIQPTFSAQLKYMHLCLWCWLTDRCSDMSWVHSTLIYWSNGFVSQLIDEESVKDTDSKSRLWRSLHVMCTANLTTWLWWRIIARCRGVKQLSSKQVAINSLRSGSYETITYIHIGKFRYPWLASYIWLKIILHVWPQASCIYLIDF